MAHAVTVALSVTAAATGGIAFLAREQGTSIPTLLGRLSHAFSAVDFNNGLFAAPGGVRLSFFFAGVLVSAIAVQLAATAVVRAASRTARTKGWFAGARDAAIGVVLLVAAVQAISTAGLFLEERAPLSRAKSLYYFNLNRRIGGEADRLKELIPQGSTVRLVTDMPYKKRDPWMYTHRALRYFLYPTVMEDAGGGATADYILYYRKRRIAESLPAGYEIVGRLSAETAVAARAGRARGGEGR